MAIVNVPEEGRTILEPAEIAAYLSAIGIGYERWDAPRQTPPEAGPEEILAAYLSEVERLKRQGGYVTADVIDVDERTPGLEQMLGKFSREHWHDEDEVRFIIEGRGLFHVRPRTGPVVAIEVGPGDLLLVPRGTWHWFNLCSERRIRAIRLFQEAAGWTPHYTGSGADDNYQPVCLGASHVARAAGALTREAAPGRRASK